MSKDKNETIEPEESAIDAGNLDPNAEALVAASENGAKIPLAGGAKFPAPGPMRIQQPPALLPAQTQVDRLLEMAVTNNADMDKLEKLLELKERYEREEARKAYTAAMAAFKGEGLVINKDRQVSFPHKDGDGITEYRHASLGNVIALATPLMALHGLSHRWDRQRDEARIKVRCVVTHKDGHSEVGDWWDGPLDESGRKNPLQQGSSTTTYLERYTFLAITGLATEDQDDDGRDSGDPVELITEEQALILHSKITDNALDMKRFLTWLACTPAKVATIEDIPAEYFERVDKKVDALIKAEQQ